MVGFYEACPPEFAPVARYGAGGTLSDAVGIGVGVVDSVGDGIGEALSGGAVGSRVGV